MLVPSILTNDFTDFFDDVFTNPWGVATRRGPEAKSIKPVPMTTDVKEYKDHFELELELPGFKKEELQAELKDGYLTVSAQHEDHKEEKDKEGRMIRKERYSGMYQRSFYVGENMEEGDIQAAFEDGVLKLNIPKKEEQPKVEERKLISIT